MNYPSNNSLRSKIFILLLLITLWTVSAFGGSSDATPSPECKAAVGLVKLAVIDVEEAFQSLDQISKKSGRALDDRKREVDHLFRIAKGVEDVSLQKSRVDRSQTAWEKIKSEESSSQGHLRQTLQRYGQRVSDVRARCGGAQ